MAATRTAIIGTRTVTVRELTFSEIRDWQVEVETRPGEDPVHALAFDEFSLADLARMSDIPVRDLETYSPSDLAPLISVCKELNPHFFRVRAALSRAVRMMLMEALASTGQPASS